MSGTTPAGARLQSPPYANSGALVAEWSADPVDASTGTRHALTP